MSEAVDEGLEEDEEGQERSDAALEGLPEEIVNKLVDLEKSAGKRTYERIEGDCVTSSEVDSSPRLMGDIKWFTEVVVEENASGGRFMSSSKKSKCFE